MSLSFLKHLSSSAIVLSLISSVPALGMDDVKDGAPAATVARASAQPTVPAAEAGLGLTDNRGSAVVSANAARVSPQDPSAATTSVVTPKPKSKRDYTPRRVYGRFGQSYMLTPTRLFDDWRLGLLDKLSPHFREMVEKWEAEEDRDGAYGKGYHYYQQQMGEILCAMNDRLRREASTKEGPERESLLQKAKEALEAATRFKSDKADELVLECLLTGESGYKKDLNKYHEHSIHYATHTAWGRKRLLDGYMKGFYGFERNPAKAAEFITQMVVERGDLEAFIMMIQGLCEGTMGFPQNKEEADRRVLNHETLYKVTKLWVSNPVEEEARLKQFVASYKPAEKSLLQRGQGLLNRQTVFDAPKPGRESLQGQSVATGAARPDFQDWKASPPPSAAESEMDNKGQQDGGLPAAVAVEQETSSQGRFATFLMALGKYFDRGDNQKSDD